MARRSRTYEPISLRTLLLMMILISAALHASVAAGRWRLPSEEKEAQLKVLHRLEVQVDANGTTSEVYDTTYTVLSEEARADLAFIRRTYNPEVTEYKKISALTVHKGKRFPVAQSAISDAPIHGRNAGFDQLRQTVLAIPKVEVGSEIQVHEEVANRPLVGDHYSQRFYVGGYLGLEAWDLTIRSQKPLFIKVNDPHKRLKVTQTQKNHVYTVTMKTTKPVFLSVIDDGNFGEDLKWTWFEVSSDEKWETLFNPLIEDWSEVLAGPLPEPMKKIVNQAKRIPDDVARLNYVLKAVYERVNYAGDWRSVRGKYIPNSFKDTFARGYGDCKDYSAITTRVLRELGFAANPALVHSGLNPRERTPQLPSLAGFNHAIVRAQKGDRVFWLDPTQWPTLAEITPDNIDDRTALELRLDGPKLQTIPAPQAKDEKIIENASLAIDDKFLRYNHNLELSGRNYLRVKNLQKSVHSQAELAYSILEKIIGIPRAKIKDLKLLSLNENHSASSHSFAIRVQYAIENTLWQVGPYYVLGMSDMAYRTFDFNREDRVLWQLLPRAHIFESKISVQNVKVGSENLPICEVQSPWIKAQRTSRAQKNSEFVVEETIVRPVSSLEVDEMKSAEFVATRDKLLSCFKKPAVLLKPLNPSSQL